MSHVCARTDRYRFLTGAARKRYGVASTVFVRIAGPRVPGNRE
jgi:hypothetical protein